MIDRPQATPRVVHERQTVTSMLPCVEHAVTVQGDDGPTLDHLLRDGAAARGSHETGRLVFAGRVEDLGPLADSAIPGLICLQGGTSKHGLTTSAQAFAIRGALPEPVEHQGRRLGCIYEDGHARYCRLGPIVPTDRHATRQDQAREVFEGIALVLGNNGFEFSDTIRTWFYLDRLLEWYTDFNDVRTAFFAEHGLFGKIVPASTGIEAANIHGTALCCGLLAMRPKTGALRIRAVESPMQCSALRYRSSFSRAVELDFPTCRHLLVSGTASIDPDGRTVHVDDCRGQILLSMRVLETLLRSRGMGWGDLCRGIAYFQDLADLPLFVRTCRDLGIPDFPLATVQTGICRADLLFEIEADATVCTVTDREATNGNRP